MLTQTQTCNIQACGVSYYVEFTPAWKNGLTINTSTTATIPTGFTFISTMTFDSTKRDPGLVLSDPLTLSAPGSAGSILTNYQIQLNSKVVVSATLLNSQNVAGRSADNAFFGILTSTPTTYLDQICSIQQSAGYGDDKKFWYNSLAHPNYLYYSGPQFIGSQSVDIAIDTVNYKMWARVNGGSWNGDPENNGGGNSISYLFS